MPARRAVHGLHIYPQLEPLTNPDDDSRACSRVHDTLLIALPLRYVFVSPEAAIITSGILLAFLSAALFSIERRNTFLWLRQLTRTQQLTMESAAAVILADSKPRKYLFLAEL